MAYNRIAKQWHAVTGSQGGALKKYVLNDLILNKIEQIAGISILELGAGNGYFIPLMLKRFSGQIPSKIVITDQSKALLEIAKKHFHVQDAKYMVLDVRKDFKFRDREFGLILSTMLFNELTKGGLFRALKECNRVMNDQGLLLATVLHPEFINNLDKRGMLKQHPKGFLTMSGAKGLQLPVVKRNVSEYYYLFEQTRFRFTAEEVYPTKKVLSAKSGLQYAGKCPLAIIFTCKKISD